MEKKILFGLLAALVQIAGIAKAADFTVINTNNAGPGSLRQAILDANANPGADRVMFQIAGNPPFIIQPTTALPDITDSVDIDGYSQPGSMPNTERAFDNAVRLVELDGVSQSFNGLVVRASNSRIRGLSVRRFVEAITIVGSSNMVVGNKVGTDLAPTLFDLNDPINASLGNLNGVVIYGESGACCNSIGAANVADRNVIAGNNGGAIRLGDGAEVVDTRIIGNFLGVDSSGIRPSVNNGNSTVSIYSIRGIWIGGSEDGAGNVISSASSAIRFHMAFKDASVVGNYIGVGADGHSPFPNLRTGIEIQVLGDAIEPVLPVNCLIASNIIANCRLYGIGLAENYPPFVPYTSGVSRVTISMNSMYANTNADGSPSQSIALARTNDFLDLDIGANNRQNYPELTSATFGENTTIAGGLNSAAFSTYRIEFFGSTVPHPSGFGEGEVYLGFTNVTTDVDGAASFAGSFPGVLATKPYITATATDSDGNTSMFSRPVHGLSPDKPLFHLHPVSATVLPYTNLLFTADVTGAVPLSLQWTKDGVPIAGATNLSLSLSDIVWDDRGSYVLVASNAFGVVSSETAEVMVLAEPSVLVQPFNALVNPGSNVNFSVQAGGMLPIAYQWFWNGAAIPGATGPTLTVTNVDWPMRGDYSVVLSNAFGVTLSDVVTLAVKIRPTITQQPLSQAVVSNGFVTLTVAITNSATAPLTYLWRSNVSVVAVETTTNYVSALRVGPVRANSPYTVQVTNAFSPSGVLSSRANVTMLADSDGDGIPDNYESAYGMNSEDPGDAGLDSDGDGVSNRDEYEAGTDPTDLANQLRVEQIELDGAVTWLEFQTRSNKTYVVEFRESTGQGAWQAWRTVPARATNGMERLSDMRSGGQRFYRLKTPAGD